MPLDIHATTLKHRPDFEEQIDALHDKTWGPELAGADWQVWEHLFDPATFAEFQVVLHDGSDVVIGVGHTVPLTWDGTMPDLPDSLNAMIERGLDDLRNDRTPNTLGALAAVVSPAHLGRGLSYAIIREMRNVASSHHLTSVIVPVGPTNKHRYPLTPMEDYITWRREDGSLFDDWMRVHEKLGARILGVAPATAISTGTVKQWEQWAGMRFPQTGRYVVPGAQQPVEIDCEKDRGTYVDPGVWMLHQVPEPTT